MDSGGPAVGVPGVRLAGLSRNSFPGAGDLSSALPMQDGLPAPRRPGGYFSSRQWDLRLRAFVCD